MTKLAQVKSKTMRSTIVENCFNLIDHNLQSSELKVVDQRQNKTKQNNANQVHSIIHQSLVQNRNQFIHVRPLFYEIICFSIVSPIEHSHVRTTTDIKHERQ